MAESNLDATPTVWQGCLFQKPPFMIIIGTDIVHLWRTYRGMIDSDVILAVHIMHAVTWIEGSALP